MEKIEVLIGEVIQTDNNNTEIQLQIGDWPKMPHYELRVFKTNMFKDELNNGDFVKITISTTPGMMIHRFEKTYEDHSEMFKQKDFFDKYGPDLIPE